MQIFGKLSATLHIARRLSCNYSARRYTSLVPAHKKSTKELLLLTPQHEGAHQVQQQQLLEYQNGLRGIARHQYLNDMTRQQQQYHIINCRNNEMSLVVMNLASTLNVTEPIKIMFIPTRNLKDSLDALVPMQSKDKTNDLNALENKRAVKNLPNTNGKVSKFVIMNIIKGYENFQNHQNYSMNGMGKLYPNPIVLNFNTNRDTIKSNLIISKFFSTNAKEKAQKSETAEKASSSHVVCEAKDGKGCISPGNAQYPPYTPVTNQNKEQQQQTTSTASSYIVCVAESGKGCISPGNSQYASYEPMINKTDQETPMSTNVNVLCIDPNKNESMPASSSANLKSQELSNELARMQNKKCNPDHDYKSYDNMFGEETLLKCDAYTKALQDAIKLKDMLEAQQETFQETKLDTVIASCGESSNSVKYPMYVSNSSANANANANANMTCVDTGNTSKSLEYNEDPCNTLPEARCTEEIENEKTSNQINKPEMKATSAYPNNSGAMICRSFIPQSKLFNRIPLRSAIQYKSRGMHAAKKGGKNDKCKADPCKDEEEKCPEKCDEVFDRVRQNEEIKEQRKKMRKLVGCPPNKNKQKSTGVCAHVIPKKVQRNKDGGNKKKYHTLLHMRPVPVFQPKSKSKSEIITKADYHNFAVPMIRTYFKTLLKPKIEIGKKSIFFTRSFTKTSWALKDGKGSPCKSKDKGKAQSKKQKKPNPCEKPAKEYSPKCNADPCSDKSKKKEGSGGDKKKLDAKKKSDMCKKLTEEKKKDVSCKKSAEEKKKTDPCKKKEDAKKKEDPCKKTGDAKKKEDPCKKKGDAKKKEDPCKKKGDAKKKEDPCKKKGDAKKKEDPCKKKGDAKKKEDPCKKKGDAKKKEDPCKKKGDAKKKEDPCKKKGDAKKKEDPCKKKGDAKKKEDPCKKKGDAKKKEDPCKKKGDAKKKEDPCKKKGEGKKKDESSKKICGTNKKETKPNCKKYATSALSNFSSTPLKAFTRNLSTFNIRKQYHIFNMPFKRHLYQTKLASYTNFIKRNNLHTSLSVSTMDPVKSLPGKRSIATYNIKKSFIASNFGPRRSYGSGKGSSDGKSKKRKVPDDCGTANLVRPNNRKPDPRARPRDRLKENCFQAASSNSGSCSSIAGGLCPDPSKTACKDYAKQNMKKSSKTKSGSTTKENEKFNLLKFYAQSIIQLKSFILTTPITKAPLIQAASLPSHQYLSKKNFYYSTRYTYRTIIPRSHCKTCPEVEERHLPTTQAIAETVPEARTRSNHSIKHDDVQQELICNERNEIIQICRACKIRKVYADIPNFSDYDVLIRMSDIAISGSDIHIYEHGTTNSSGITLGHDATGIIEKAGKCIYGLRRGDRVVVESSLSCGICEFCKRGAYNMCMHLIYNGFLMKYQVHPADLCHKLPDNLNITEATLTHTLAQGCQAIFKAHVTPTTNVLIMGSSPIALASAICARAIGAKHVILTCTMHAALESIHNDFDFDYVHYDGCIEFAEILEGIFSAFNDWPDVVINCAINERTMNLAVMSLRPCGICILAECESEGASFNALDVLMKNIRMLPSFRSTNMFPTALHLMHTGRASMSRMIASKFSWCNIDDAFQTAQCESNNGYKKVVIQCMEEHLHNYKIAKS